MSGNKDLHSLTCSSEIEYSVLSLSGIVITEVVVARAARAGAPAFPAVLCDVISVVLSASLYALPIFGNPVCRFAATKFAAFRHSILPILGNLVCRFSADREMALQMASMSIR